MERGCAIAYLTMLTMWAVAADSLAQTVDFESVAPGTTFGQAYGNTPGEIVLTQEGIAMSVEEFFLNTFVGFVRAEVGGRYDDYFPTTPLELDNIGVRFDFADVGFDVNLVTLEFQEFGGGNNFAVNDEILFQVSPLTALPSDVAAGVTASVDAGVITLMGAIDSFQIGGQELGIDNVTAVPEPASILLFAFGGVALLHRRHKA